MPSTTSGNALRAIIYARVSSDKAKGRSVKEQVAECRAECERRGWPVAEVLTDNDRSASRFATKDRPEYARLRDLLSPGDVLVTWEASRAQRDLARYVELRDLCAERGVFWSYSGRLFDLEDGDDRFATGLDALLAEKEADQTRTRILRAHRANLAAGKPHGRVPYGYKIIRDPDTGKAIGREPDPECAPLVSEAARRVLAGHSLASVTRWIEEHDPLGWNEAKLRRILTNPTSAGYRTRSTVVNGKRGPQEIHGPGTWEPIIPPEQHDELVALFAARKAGPRGVGPKHLLSGIAVCGICGDPMWRGYGGYNKDGGYFQVYSCRKNHLGRRMCFVDEAVHQVVEGILSSPEARAELAAPPDNPDPGAAARLADLKARLEGVEEQIIEGKMPPATGARITARLVEQIAAAEAATTPVFTDPTVRKVATAPEPVKVWRELSVPEKRDFIRAVLTVTVHPIGRGRWHDKRTGIVVDPRRSASV
ncbi:MAG: recombinase family protein [Mycobacterium sp.]|jgi:DNA invertase Pin-like site-specific DNA recombinase|nr:MAG: recombinase family protein [Mycobacterium sp.]